MESPKDRRNCNPSEEISSNGNNNPSENNPQEQQSPLNTDNGNNKSSKALVALKSQDHLNCIIDRHTRELDQLLEDAPLPFVMQHTAKVSGVRTRVSSLNSLLKSIQRRIDNIDPILSVGSTQVCFQIISSLVIFKEANYRELLKTFGSMQFDHKLRKK
ncbi:hypothetical protein MANES_06G171100v8 [Manihot esculenta]|uniref:Uncharacterized protein n=1 Tax=Manihot esculenta TaxID=3983 RepID=A0ACB7HN71_MANES|nr:hypothetical protein MANES_06G171100v8 [Manihot esculenta]